MGEEIFFYLKQISGQRLLVLDGGVYICLQAIVVFFGIIKIGNIA